MRAPFNTATEFEQALAAGHSEHANDSALLAGGGNTCTVGGEAHCCQWTIVRLDHRHRLLQGTYLNRHLHIFTNQIRRIEDMQSAELR